MKQKILDILKEKGSGFRVPDRYFDTIEDRLMSMLNTEKFPKESGFSVPANYFESLETQIFSKLEEESLSKDQGYKVPAGYFDTVESKVLEKLDLEAPELSGSDIPTNYFDTLEDRVFARLAQEEKEKSPKVISLGARLRKVWVPVAVAASLALLLTLPGIFDKNQTGVTVAEMEEVLNSFDSYELAEVFSDVDLAANEVINEEEELLDYLNGTDVESMLLEN